MGWYQRNKRIIWGALAGAGVAALLFVNPAAAFTYVSDVASYAATNQGLAAAGIIGGGAGTGYLVTRCGDKRRKAEQVNGLIHSSSGSVKLKKRHLRKGDDTNLEFKLKNGTGYLSPRKGRLIKQGGEYYFQPLSKYLSRKKEGPIELDKTGIKVSVNYTGKKAETVGLLSERQDRQAWIDARHARRAERERQRRAAQQQNQPTPQEPTQTLTQPTPQEPTQTPTRREEPYNRRLSEEQKEELRAITEHEIKLHSIPDNRNKILTTEESKNDFKDVLGNLKYIYSRNAPFIQQNKEIIEELHNEFGMEFSLDDFLDESEFQDLSNESEEAEV